MEQVELIFHMSVAGVSPRADRCLGAGARARCSALADERRADATGRSRDWRTRAQRIPYLTFHSKSTGCTYADRPPRAPLGQHPRGYVLRPLIELLA